MKELPKLLNLGPASSSVAELCGGLLNLPDSYQSLIDQIINPNELITTSAASYGALRLAEVYDQYVRRHGKPHGVAIMTPPIFHSSLEKALRARDAAIFYPEYRRINGTEVFLGFVEAPNPFAKQHS